MKPLTRLENFLAKIAGDPDAKMDMKPKTRKEKYLDAIANNGIGGESQLPEVQPIDDGKVLQVVDGKWDVANPPLPKTTGKAFGKAIYVDGMGGYPDPNNGDSIGRACVFMTEEYSQWFDAYKLDINGYFLVPALCAGVMPIFVRKPVDGDNDYTHGYEIGMVKSWNGDVSGGTMVVAFPSGDLSYTVDNGFDSYPIRK